jgi:hypothetical protein
MIGVMNWKGYGRSGRSPNLRYYPGISLEGLKKTTKTVRQGAGLRAEI